MPCWVTFEGSPARVAPRSPLHDSWASPGGLSPFEAQPQHGSGCGTMRRLQLEPSVEEAAGDLLQGDADDACPQEQNMPAGAPETSPRQTLSYDHVNRLARPRLCWVGHA